MNSLWELTERPGINNKCGTSSPQLCSALKKRKRRPQNVGEHKHKKIEVIYSLKELIKIKAVLSPISRL